MMRRLPVSALLLLVWSFGCTSAETVDDPEIAFFQSSLSETLTEGETLLSWSVRGAKELRLEEGGELLEEGLPLEGRRSVSPSSTSSYRLIATGSHGSASASLTVRVLPTPPLIRWFHTEARRIGPEQHARLRWKVDRASQVRVTDSLGDIDIERTGPTEGQALVQPFETTAFTLIASNAAGESRASLVLGVHAGPNLAFWSDRPTVELGEEATLSWEASGASSLSLYGGEETLVDQAVSRGSHVVAPERSTVYRAVADGEGGQRQIHVRVEVSPAVDAFQMVDVSPRRVGSQVEVSWAVRGADTLELSDAEGRRWQAPEALLPGGAVEVPVPEDGVIQLTAWREGVPARRKLHVPLTEGPRIEAWQALAEELGADGRTSVALSWRVEAATSLEILALPGGLVDLPEVNLSEDQIRLPISRTTVFRLTARNPKGSHTRFATAESHRPEERGPLVSLFRVDPALVLSGAPLRFLWESTGASVSRICTPQGDCFCEQAESSRVSKGECILPAPSGDGAREVTLHLSDAQGRTSSQAAAFTVMDEARIPWISARPNPSFVDTAAGSFASLHWSSRNAASVEIHALGPDGSPGARLVQIPVGGEGASGSLHVEPNAPPLARYRITATNALGWPSHTDVLVRVDPATLEAFSASAVQVHRGEAVDLLWRSARASELILERVGTKLGREMPWSPVNGPDALAIDLPGAGEEATLEFPQDFTFPWGGERRGAARISQRGILSFSWEASPLVEGARRLPAADLPPLMAPFWDELDPKESGSLHAELRADEEGRALVVEWRHFQFAESTEEEPADLNFQVWLRESGAFEFRYGDMRSLGSGAATEQARADGARASIGYQRGEGRGESLSFRGQPEGGLQGRVFSGGRTTLEAGGSLRLLPQVSTRYRIAASNPHSSDEATLEIEVLP